MSQQTASTGVPFLIIVNFIPPYDAEIAGLLSGPVGARVRFRYQTKYAPTISRVESLQGRMGTILLRDRATGWFMPLRGGRICSSKLVGDVIYLSVELGETAAISTDTGVRVNQIQQFNELTKRAIGTYPNTGNTDLLNLILHEQGDIASLLQTWIDASQDDEVAHWGNVVRLLDEHYPGLDLDFFKVLGVKGNRAREVRLSEAGTELPCYVVNPGEELKVEVLQRTYTGKSGDSSVATSRALELSVLRADISLRQGSLPILGKYDILSFSMYISQRATPGIHQSLLSIVREDRGQRYGIELPFLVKRAGIQRAVRLSAVVAFVVSLFAYVSPDTVIALLESAPFHLAPSPTSETVDKAAVVSMLISANATGLTNWIADHTQLG